MEEWDVGVIEPVMPMRSAVHGAVFGSNTTKGQHLVELLASKCGRLFFQSSHGYNCTAVLPHAGLPRQGKSNDGYGRLRRDFEHVLESY